ncbi:MAG: CmpA/NrtA family ABC transporter substrate-binding protein [Verrucomicrobiota bacterium]
MARPKMTKTRKTVPTKSYVGKLYVGYVPLIDAAPLIVAQEFGLFDKYGVQVRLQRELGWASIRDKVVFGELQAAHAPAGLVFSAQLGIRCQQRDCVTGLVINSHGNAITISKKLFDAGVVNAKGMATRISLESKKRSYTFGTVSMVSSHYFLLTQWLKSGGINPDKDVRVVVLPPSLMAVNMKEGNIDGFCAGEPWNSLTALEGVGVIINTSEELAPGHPEKVLLASREFVDNYRTEYTAMGAAILEACEICSKEENFSEIAKLLSHRSYLNVKESVVSDSLSGRLPKKRKNSTTHKDFIVFYDDQANAPLAKKATWVWRNLEEGVLYPYLQEKEVKDMLEQTFRMDLFYEMEQQVKEVKNADRQTLLA